MATLSGPVSASQNNPLIRMIPQARIESIDLLRGLVMVIMALDHTRESFTYIRRPPEILQFSYLALFFTRWITHFCAPAFFFLAGDGSFPFGVAGKEVGGSCSVPCEARGVANPSGIHADRLRLDLRSGNDIRWSGVRPGCLYVDTGGDGLAAA